MKSVLVVTLVLAVVTCQLPLVAQEWTPSRLRTCGPASTKTPSIANVAAVAAHASRLQSSVDWKGVRRNRQGKEVTVTLEGGTVVKGWFIRADEQKMTVLVPMPGVKGAAKNSVEELSKSEIWTRPAGEWSVTYLDKTRATPEGLFSPSGDMLAQLRTIERQDVVTATTSRSSAGKIAMWTGIVFLGMLVISIAACANGSCA